jgi:hypothetical protein
MSAVFPDSNEPRRTNGGLDSQATLKENTLEALSDPSNNVEATLIARPTKKIMQDTTKATICSELSLCNSHMGSEPVMQTKKRDTESAITSF